MPFRDSTHIDMRGTTGLSADIDLCVAGTNQTRYPTAARNRFVAWPGVLRMTILLHGEIFDVHETSNPVQPAQACPASELSVIVNRVGVAS